MRKRPHLLTLWLALFFAAVFAAGLWIAAGQALGQRRRLPDGTVLTLDKVTYGTQHGYVHRSWWQRLLGPMLPRELRPGGISAGTRFDHNGLVIWLLASDPPRGVAKAAGNRLHRVLQCELSDEGGARLGPFLCLLRTDARGLSLAPCPQFPRRGKTVRLQLYEPDQAAPVAEFVVPNPDPGPHPTWTPEPLPITRHSGGLTVALIGLETERQEARSPHHATSWRQPKTRATFRIHHARWPAADWEPAGIVLSDATGNVLKAQNRVVSARGNETSIRFGGALSVAETAWRLRVEFARHARARFSPDESWTVRDLPIPGRNAVFRPDTAAVRQGVRLELVGIGGTGRNVWPDAGGRGYKGSKVTARVRAASLREGQRLTLRAMDERGREFVGHDPHPRHTRQGWDYLFQLDLPPDAGRLTLTCAVQKSRIVEFLAKPALESRKPPK